MHFSILRPLLASAQKNPGKAAIIDRGSTVTYTQFLKDLNAFACWYQSLDDSSKQTVIMLPNGYPMALAIYGCAAANRVFVPVDYNMHFENVCYILKNAEANVLITDSKFAHLFENVHGLTVVNIDEAWTDDVLRSETIASLDLKPEDPLATIMYTTGTTGPQKGVMLSHANLNQSARNITEFMSIADDIVESIPMPLSHSFGFGRLRVVLNAGGTAVLEQGLLRPEIVLFNIQRLKVNALSLVPTGFDFFQTRLSVFFDIIAPQLKYIELGSAPMTAHHKSQLLSKCPNAVICMHYGLTEGSRSSFLNFSQDRDFLDSVGRPSPNCHIKIIPVNQDEEATGCGRIAISGDHVAMGYWKMPDTTENAFVNGWLQTGDLGRFDENGYLYFIGREDDMINTHGLKVSPVEVENVIKKMPNIDTCAVVGIPDTGANNLDHTVKVFVTFGCKVTLGDIQVFCRKYMEPYKIPTVLEFIDRIPVTSSGKIQRTKLRLRTTPND